MNHLLECDDRGGVAGPQIASPVTIEDDVWVGGGAIICPDAKTKQRIDHLKNYKMLSGHQHGDPICPSCVSYEAVVRQRKKLCKDGAAKHLVLMLDHWQRIPPITPQARGATRASSPTTK